jgi:glycosyltransferase involved in cell wall biosynthesis
VRGFSCRVRGLQLAVLGAYSDDQRYHRAIQDAASDQVRFLGAIYDPALLQSLRAHSVAYVHGHQVGGTNPSLVEALAAGNAVIAHDNRFNRWVAADGAQYFRDAIDFDQVLSRVLASPALLQRMRERSRERFAEAFTWDIVLAAYETLLLRLMARGGRAEALAADEPPDGIGDGLGGDAVRPWPLRRDSACHE